VKPRSRGGSVPLVASQKSALSPERPRWLCNLSGNAFELVVTHGHKKTNDVGAGGKSGGTRTSLLLRPGVSSDALRANPASGRRRSAGVSVTTRTYEGGSKTEEGELIVCFISSFGKRSARGSSGNLSSGGKRAPVVPRARVAVSATTTRCQGGALLLSCIYPPAPRNTGAPRPNKRTLGLFFNRKVGSRKVGPKATPGGLVSF
jgi:hypothetical protein